MKLYNGMTPNGARVAIFLAEKGIEVPVEDINVVNGDTRQPTFLAINALGEVPVLELDDGRYLTESIAICRYFEGIHPEPPLFGRTTEEQAFVEMWNRRMELRLQRAIGDVGLHEFEFFKDKVEQNADYAANQRRAYLDCLRWLDDELSDGRAFIVGDSLSVADITGFAALMIAGFAGIETPGDLANVIRWSENLRSRSAFPQAPN